MGKYSEFDRETRDYYPTPIRAVEYLIQHLKKEENYELERYIEPCVGDGRLVSHISDVSMVKNFSSSKNSYSPPVCVYASDIEPQVDDLPTTLVYSHDAVNFNWDHSIDSFNATAFVTNPPWLNTAGSKHLLNSIIKKLSSHLPTWLLLNGNYAWNLKSATCMSMCTDVVPVGRVKWIEDSDNTGKEDCAWFRFVNTKSSPAPHYTVLHERMKV